MFPKRPLSGIALRSLLIGVCLASPLSGAAAQTSLRPGDTISVTVFEVPQLTGIFAIGADGTIAYPLLGALKVAGASPQSLAANLEKLLEERYLHDAKVSVVVGARPDSVVMVVGQVATPGTVTFSPTTGLDVFTAIASVGGLTEAADEGRIELKRGTSSRFYTLESSKRIALTDGDSVIVASLGRLPEYSVMGEVNRPGVYTIPRGREVFLLEALSLAGGLTDKAYQRWVNVQRGGVTSKVSIKKIKDGDEKFQILPGDRIIARESWY